MWGMSYGGKLSRYLAVQSKRVEKFIMMGTPMGMGVSGERRKQAEDFCARWSPIVAAQRDGKLDLSSLSRDDLAFFQNQNLPVMLGWVSAMLDWPAVEPADFHCPTFWLIGSEDPYAMVTYKDYEETLKESKVQVQIIQGLDHDQVFDEVDRVFPIMLEFTQS